jgi:hypothetical protein
MTPVLSDVRGDRRQLRHLMPTRIPDGMPAGQSACALATRLGREIHDRVHALDGHQRPMASRMPRLTAWLPPTLPTPAAHARLTSQTVGRWWFRGEGGILLAQRELALEVADAFRLISVLLAEPLVLATQTLDLRRIGARHGRLRRRWCRMFPLCKPSPFHASESTESRDQVQEA